MHEVSTAAATDTGNSKRSLTSDRVNKTFINMAGKEIRKISVVGTDREVVLNTERACYMTRPYKRRRGTADISIRWTSWEETWWGRKEARGPHRHW